jgi:hypothetical protein
MQQITQIRQKYAANNSSSLVFCKKYLKLLSSVQQIAQNLQQPATNKSISRLQQINQTPDPHAINKPNSPEVSHKRKT